MARTPRAPGLLPANLVDRVIGYFDPAKAGRRILQRQALGAMTGGYTGAKRSRKGLVDWFPLGGSANDDLLPDLPALRERSRDLERNAPLARGAISTIATSVVGTGLVPIPAIDRDALGLSRDEADRIERDLTRIFLQWAYTLDADTTRGQTFLEQQELALRSALVSGDVFAVERYVDRPGARWLLSCQLVEADRVENPAGLRDGAEAVSGFRLAGGVELDPYGAPVAVYVRNKFPGRAARENAPPGEGDHVRLPIYGAVSGRRRVHHVFRRTRIDATRGEPLLAPVIETLKQLGDYTENEVHAAVVSSLFTVFVKSKDGSGLADVPVEGSTSERAAAVAGGEVKLGRGAIIDLMEGEDIVTANPGRPNDKFDGFVLAVCRQIGAALELPFELLVKHFTASYSASRAAMLEAWRMYRARRVWLGERFCQPFYEAVIFEAVLRRRIDLPGFLDDPLAREAYLWCEWRGPAPGHIDEEKAVRAAQARIDGRFSTRARETAELTGEDWRRVEDQRQAEDARVADTGGAPASRISPPADDPAENPDDERED
ncbi:phage portal protein [Thalassobaculum sp.]|uniref:phage portal protein n=1 Tax=Thalassobaculum sp. TaxID=2022740 RepID=UPI0032EC2E45